MSTTVIFFEKEDNPKMLEAFKKAQETFKFFWRELSWEYRRIVPALDIACVKVAFSQYIEGCNEPIVEHMWIIDVEFDGEKLKGILINDPNELTNVQNGDAVEIPLHQISDWLFAEGDKTYGGFTIQAMRSDMNDEERNEHDNAWGKNFGDYNDILVVRGQKEHPENLIEHPMSKNMKERLVDHIKQHSDLLTDQDEQGYNLLHRETIAGNRTSVEVLKNAGIKLDMKTTSGKTALDFANELKWEHIIELLQG